MFCDTSFLVLKIWSEYRFGKCDPWILEQFEKEDDKIYLLCTPDIPWEPDPKRENPNDRNILFETYRKELIEAKKQYIQVAGSQKDRLNYSIQSLLHL